MTGPLHLRVDPFLPSPGKKQRQLVDLLRLDLLHPIVSGNKWFKLSPYLRDAEAQGKKTILTWGGAWSNHILATAYACRQSGLECRLVIRGERPARLSATLQQVLDLGAELIFLPRHLYREKQLPPLPGINDACHIPEGGSGEAGVAGAAALTRHFDMSGYDVVACAAGTGTTAAGLLRGLRPDQELWVIPVLKGAEGMKEEITRMSGTAGENLIVRTEYHFGGYARTNPDLFRFMNDRYRATGIPSDFVYTAKLFYAVTDLLEKNEMGENKKVLVIHSGGLQGNRSLEKGTLIFQDL